MAGITTAVCNSYKQQALDGVHNSGDTYKIALIKAGMAGTFDKTSLNYSDLGTDEVTGTGYTAGGAALSGYASGLSGDTAYIDFTADPSWPAATISARGCMVYNSSQGNKAVAVYDFGATITSTAWTFTVTLPAPGATAIVRVT